MRHTLVRANMYSNTMKEERRQGEGKGPMEGERGKGDKVREGKWVNYVIYLKQTLFKPITMCNIRQ